MRDAEVYFARWAYQIERVTQLLWDQRGLTAAVVVLENDSQDTTPGLLQTLRRSTEGTIIASHVRTGMHYWPSIDNVVRWNHLGKLCEAVRRLQLSVESAFLHVYVECDLVWDPMTVLELVDMQAKSSDKLQAISPKLMCEWAPMQYYDTWGTVGLDGVPFSAQAPYHDSMSWGKDLVSVASVAGMTVLPTELLRASSWKPRGEDRPEAYRSWCSSMRVAGAEVLLSTKHQIYHPAPREG